jgi:hypothetical protein
MVSWPTFRRFCLYGLVASIIVAPAFWLAKTKHSEHSRTYYRDVVLPALEQPMNALASHSATVPNIGSILHQHIENQSKIAESYWRLSLSVISAQVFGLGLMICRLRAEVVKRREDISRKMKATEAK